MERFYKYPKLIIGIVFIITIFFALQLPKLTLNNDTLVFIPDDNPEVLKYKETEEIFGSDMIIGVALEIDHGTILSPEFLLLVDELSTQFEEIPGVDTVMSLTNTDFISGTADGMKVEPLLDQFSGTREEIVKLKEKLLSWDIYEGVLYSRDFSATQIAITLEGNYDEKMRESIYFTIRDHLQGIEMAGVSWYIAGAPSLTVLISHNMRSDLNNLIPLVVAVVILALYFSFRRLGGVVLPLTTVLVSTVWTIGLMALLGITLTMIDTIIPILLVAVGSAYGIHIISHYYDELRVRGNRISEEDHRKIIFNTIRQIGKPVALAGLTTIIGFGSLMTSEVSPMRNFGIFTAIGVLAALIVAVILIPSLLLLRHKALKLNPKNPKEDAAEKIMSALFHFFNRRKIRVLLFAVIIAIGGIYGTTKVIKDFVLVEYFKEDTEIRQADRFLREKFNGTDSFNIIVRGEERGDLTNPEILKAMDGLAQYLLDKYPEVSKISSFTDLVKKMNQVMNYTPPAEEDAIAEPEADAGEGGFVSFFDDPGVEDEESGFTGFFDNTAEETPDPEATVRRWQDLAEEFSYEDFLILMNQAYINAGNSKMSALQLIQQINRELNYRGAGYYEIPWDPDKYPVESREELQNLITQYLLLFSGELSSFLDDPLEPLQARMLVQLTSTGSIRPMMVAEAAETYAKANFPPGYTIETTGMAKVMNTISRLITGAQTRSIIISIFLVFLIITLTFRSLSAGILGIIPISFTVLLNFGIMGLFGIKLDLSTAMVGSVAIGIGIDYTIHYLIAYRHERRKTDNLETVAHNTMKGVGKAVLFNAFSVALGFLVLLLSRFTPMNFFGLLIAITMFTSSTASLTILPVLLNLFKPKFISR
jgi:hydrophobe/amphiphile efflux-3 (HAE3) family protein